MTDQTPEPGVCGARHRDAVLTCELTARHPGAHEAHTTPDQHHVWSDPLSDPTPDDDMVRRADDLRTRAAELAQRADEIESRTTQVENDLDAERAAHEEHRLRLATALGCQAGADWYALAERAWAVRADLTTTRETARQAAVQVADYENRVTWETTCGEHARLLDSCRAADEARERADEALARVRKLAPALDYEATAPGMHDAAREVLRDASRRIRAALDGEQPAPGATTTRHPR